MGIKRRKTTARAGRQVSLTRDGARTAPARNTKRVQKEPRRWKIRFSWRKIGRSALVALVGCLGALIVAGISVGFLYGYRYMTRSEYFTLKDIEIQGNIRLTSGEILEATALDDGANILALSIEDIKGSLIRNQWVKEVSVKRELPGKLVIGIKERDPAFWMLFQDKMYYADERGSLIAPVGIGKFVALPTLEIEPGAEEMASELPDLIRSLRDSNLPLDMRTVSFVRLSASRGLELYVENSRLKISIGLEEWLSNVDRLDKALRDLKRRGELKQIKEIKAHGANVWVEKG